MKLTTFAQTLHDLNVIKDQGLDEVILGHQMLSRYGKLTTEEFKTFSTRARDLKLRVILEWDILMTENTFMQVTQFVTEVDGFFDALRVQDPGALEWAMENTKYPLQFIAENGNHNLLGLKTWIEYTQGRMERIVLSIELSKDVIEEYVRELPIPCELLGFGRILLFYTPRLLLSPLSSEKISVNQEIAAVGESEESPHKGFPILENRHGTFMFHIKEFCLLEFYQDLSKMGLGFFRMDLRWVEESYLPRLKSITSSFESVEFEQFKNDYPQDLMRGFYLVNKTDVLFPKLKNHRLVKREGDYVGEVVDAEKSSHLAIMIKNGRGLKKTDKLKILHPKGKEFEVTIFSLKNLGQEEVDSMPNESIALIPYLGGVWVKSQVYYC